MTKLIQTLFILFISIFSSFSLQAQHTHFETGDIFLGQGGGLIQWRDSNHVLIKTINTGDGGGNGNGTGLRIHPITGQLWVTNSNLPPGSTNGIRIINTDGSVGGTINISPYQKTPTSITFDSKGNAYVGGLWNDTGDEIVKINPAGTAILDHFKVSSDGYIYGAEWVEVDCNDSIIYYTTLGKKVKRYNVVTRQQLPDYANLLDSVSWLFAMRLLANNTMLVVAADHLVKRLDSSGAVIKTYGPTNTNSYFGLAVTADKKNFWVGGLAFYAPMHKYDIATGNIIDSFLAGPQAINVHGIAIYGDETKNCKPQPPPDSLPQLAVTNIHAYPNPSHGSFILQINLTGKLTVLIHDKLGQTVYAREYNFSGSNHNIPIDVSNLAAGIYFVQIVNGEKKVSQKIVIN
jgi:hypothetical protein